MPKMRLLEQVPAVPYQDPWNIPLPKRWAMLHKGSPRIAYFYEAPDNSTFRYRIYNMVQALQLCSSEAGASYFYFSELDRQDILRLADEIDLAVVCRVRYGQPVALLANALAKRNIPLLFDVDDLVMAPKHIPLLVNTLGLNLQDSDTWDDWFASVSRIRATLDLCNGAVVTNDFLAERIHEECNLPTAVIPNFLNREQLMFSARILAQKKLLANETKNRETIWLGYFSGSPTHNKDFSLVSSCLESFMQQDSRIHLLVVGFLQTPPNLARFETRIRRFPLQDFVNLQRLIAAVDVNLVPLQCNTFTHCKSELKFFEAAAVATPTVASPSFTYQRAIRHSETGYIASAHQWEDIIASILAQPQDIASLIRQARKDVYQRYTPRRWGRKILPLLCQASRATMPTKEKATNTLAQE